MFFVFYTENGKLYREEHTSERAAGERALYLRRACGIMAYVETDWGDYRWTQ